MYVRLLFVMAAIASCSAFGGGDDRFIKKYAMMKVYESCLGPDVLKETRLEMKAACAKCAGMAPPPVEEAAVAAVAPPPPPPKEPAAAAGSPLPPPPPPARKHGRPQHQSFDPAKLQQAILGFKSQQQLQNSYQGAASPQALKLYQQQALQGAGFPPSALYPSQLTAATPPPLYYPGGNSLYAAQPYQAPFAPFYQQQTPYYQQQVPFYQQQQQPLFPNSLGYFSQRSSRDLDLRSQLEAMTSQGGSKIRNVTCVMQELGYLDENMEPHYAHIVDRISRLPVDDELKKDMAEGVEFCRQFAQCVPDIRKDRFPLSRELVKPMFFFRCYKHKKLEACIMKDVREKYSQSDELSGEESVAGPELRSLDDDGEKRVQLDDVEMALYEFMYGGDNMEYETLM